MSNWQVDRWKIKCTPEFLKVVIKSYFLAFVKYLPFTPLHSSRQGFDFILSSFAPRERIWNKVLKKNFYLPFINKKAIPKQKNKTYYNHFIWYAAKSMNVNKIVTRRQVSKTHEKIGIFVSLCADLFSLYLGRNTQELKPSTSEDELWCRPEKVLAEVAEARDPWGNCTVLFHFSNLHILLYPFHWVIYIQLILLQSWNVYTKA